MTPKPTPAPNAGMTDEHRAADYAASMFPIEDECLEEIQLNREISGESYLAGLKEGRRLERERVKKLEELLRCFLDDEPCYFDHHGGCQAHFFLSLEPGELCPNAEAKAILTPSESEGGGG